MVSVLFGILEIEGHYQGKDDQRKLAAFADLRKATINGHDILAVIADANEKPVTVKHNDCSHDPAIKRYFCFNLIVAGDWDMLTYPVRYQVNCHTQVEITGMTLPYDGKRAGLLPQTS